MIIRTTKKVAPPKENLCTYCEKPYRAQDFSVCPHCGGDGGGIVTKSWKPNKRQKKEYAKKQNNI